MRLTSILFIALSVLASACQKPPSSQPVTVKSDISRTASNSAANQAQSPIATPASAEPRAKIDVCALLTSSEIQAVQGEPVKEAKLSGQTDGGFNVSQCFFALPTFANSISLSVTQRGEGAGARDPRKFWEDAFGGERADKDKSKRGDKAGAAEEESAPPQKVTGIGQEAVWVGSRVGGALYVLKGNSYLRISVGGRGDQALKLKKSRALAEKVLQRM